MELGTTKRSNNRVLKETFIAERRSVDSLFMFRFVIHNFENLEQRRTWPHLGHDFLSPRERRRINRDAGIHPAICSVGDEGGGDQDQVGVVIRSSFLQKYGAVSLMISC